MSSIDFSTRDSFTVRQPATALLCVDSADRNTSTWPSPYDFQIQKNQQTITGAFNRIGVTEVCFGYSTYNIFNFQQRDRIVVDISGDAGSPRTIILNQGIYTAYQALESLVSELNDLSGSTGASFSLHTPLLPNGLNPTLFQGLQWIISSAQDFTLDSIAGSSSTQQLYNLLNVADIGIFSKYWGGQMPDLRWTRYIDIVCNQLTNSQYVKDTSTLNLNRDLLCRYYFASEQPMYDEGGLIQYIGYTPFYLHRQWNVPKQIRFEPIQSIGSLRFSVYDDEGNLLEADDSTVNWNMTLQLSEN